MQAIADELESCRQPNRIDRSYDVVADPLTCLVEPVYSFGFEESVERLEHGLLGTGPRRGGVVFVGRKVRNAPDGGNWLEVVVQAW